jgi:hypothetical protein
VLKVSQKKPVRNFKVFLTQGRHLGVYTWHYVKVDLMKMPMFKNALKSGTIDVSKYGEIVFSGWGMNPPDDIRRKVDALYS